MIEEHDLRYYGLDNTEKPSKREENGIPDYLSLFNSEELWDPELTSKDYEASAKLFSSLGWDNIAERKLKMAEKLRKIEERKELEKGKYSDDMITLIGLAFLIVVVLVLFFVVLRNT